MRKLKYFVWMLVLLPLTASADNVCTNATGDSSALGACVNQIYLWALGAAGILGIMMSIWGGYLVMTARGNAQQASSGKSYLFSSLIGIALLLGAYWLLSQINPDLTNFSSITDFNQP